MTAVRSASSRWLEVDERPPHEQGAGVLRFVPNGAVERIDGGRPTSRGRPPAGRQCRRPVPSATCSRTQAPRVGGLGAAFRSEWGEGASRRRQAHEQGLAACGVLGKRLPFPKRDSQGSGPLSGCGQSPPFPPRDGCVDSVASWSAKGYASVPPARLPAVPDGQSAPTPRSPPRHAQNQARHSEALLPRRGKQRRPRTLAAPPCPCGARQRRPTHAFAGGRLRLVSLPPSAPTVAPSETKRSAPPPSAWGGRASPWGQRHWKPALPAGSGCFQPLHF